MGSDVVAAVRTNGSAGNLGVGWNPEREEARSINEFRGEHPELAMACIKQQITTEWAQMLLESGFEEHPAQR